MAVRRLRRRCDTISNIQLTQPMFASSLFTADYIGLKPHAHTHTCTRTPPYTLDNHLGAARIKVSSLRLACINYRTSLGIFMKTQRETHCGTLLTKSREPEHIIIIAPAMRWRPMKKKSCAACEDDDDISDTTLFICIACVRACSRSHCTRSMLPIFHIHHNTRSLSVEIMQHIAWHCLANSWNDTTTVKESQLYFFQYLTRPAASLVTDIPGMEPQQHRFVLRGVTAVAAARRVRRRRQRAKQNQNWRTQHRTNATKKKSVKTCTRQLHRATF